MDDYILGVWLGKSKEVNVMVIVKKKERENWEAEIRIRPIDSKEGKVSYVRAKNILGKKEIKALVDKKFQLMVQEFGLEHRKYIEVKGNQDKMLQEIAMNPL
jgi:hypothetical protein